MTVQRRIKLETPKNETQKLLGYTKKRNRNASTSCMYRYAHNHLLRTWKSKFIYKHDNRIIPTTESANTVTFCAREGMPRMIDDKDAKGGNTAKFIRAIFTTASHDDVLSNEGI